MKLTSLAVKGLAIVGAFQIYREYTNPETSDRTVTRTLNTAKAKLSDIADRPAS